MPAFLRRWVLPVVALAALTGCATATAQPIAPADAGRPAVERSAPSRTAETRESEPPVTRAREGRAAASERVRFRPRELVLSRGGKAGVEIASTVDGVLQVPEDVRHLGWWDGSAYAGDPFGSTVIAGHVDSRTQGLGFFVRLLRAHKGDVVTLRGEDGHQLRYKITKVTSVTKRALAADGAAFDQTVDHRLVLITCTGDYDPDRGGYQSNLVIYASPIGLAT